MTVQDHEAADARARRADWLSSTLDQVGDGQAVLRAVRDDDGEILDWIVLDANALVRERWSRVVDDVVGCSLRELDHAADNSPLARVYAAALEANERKVTEIELAVPGGLGGWRRIIVIPVGDDCISVVTRDISRERYFEESAQQERRRFARLAVSDEDTPGGRVIDARAMRMSGSTLYLISGLLTFLNSFITTIHGYNRVASRATGVVTVVLAVVMFFLPWDRYARVLSRAAIIVALVLLVGGDALNHYSSTPAALAVYPVYFIIVIAWSGLTQGRGAAVVTGLLSAPGLFWIFHHSGQSALAWQCVAVTLPAAVTLGEVVAWFASHAAHLLRLEAGRQLQDPLTGLANRAQFSIRLDQALARARRSGDAVAVLFTDLDRFKQVNDTLGHAAGDELLVETARRLRDELREEDTVARLGGDEFVVLCEGATVANATIVAQRMIEALGAPYSCTAGIAHVGASVGIVLCDDGTETAESMLQKADIALYRAKGSGRGRSELFDSAMQDWVSARVELEASLRLALQSDELSLAYQPIVAAEEGTIVGAEALLRWHRPGIGVIPPGDFIALAEDTGLIVEIGAWVLRTACAEAAAWARQWPDRRLGVAVNVAARQLVDGRLIQQVDEALAGSGLDPSLLTLELTESALINDSIGVVSTLATLRARGVRIAVDDFGTGYSSLTYLRTFPLDVIKIDRSFVATVAEQRGDAAIIAAMVALARNLDLVVVAEGVETEEQLAAVIYLGCPLLQGYLFSPAMPPAEFRDLAATPVMRLREHAAS